MKKVLALAVLALLPHLAIADGFDLRGVTFKPGHPTQGEPLAAAVVDRDELVGLERSAAAFRKYPNLVVEVAGHVDQYECQGLSECERLALRRAVYVFRHLLDLGVSAKQIIALREFGSTRPIAANSSEAERNSRTELNIYSEP